LRDGVSRRVAAVAVAAPLLAACAETTIDTSITAPPSVAATTTVFAPTGTTVELLDQLLAESDGLSDLIVENHGQQAAFARIETLWALVGADIGAQRPDLVPGFQSAINLLRTGVERRRPADADKAHNNLRVLVVAYTGD
jgi:hypothetical protein